MVMGGSIRYIDCIIPTRIEKKKIKKLQIVCLVVLSKYRLNE